MILIINIIPLFLFCVTNTWAHSLVEPESNALKEGDYEVKILDNNDVVEDIPGFGERVSIQIYYESLNLNSVNFYSIEFIPVLLDMFKELYVQTYPFGNTKIIEENGNLDFKCPHGPLECYGNKLHACALEDLGLGLLYNSCLMNHFSFGSNDEAVDKCAEEMHYDPEPIKECAKGMRGKQLLLYYGEITEKVKMPYLPHVLINGKPYNILDYDFKKAVCAAFTTPPPSCENVHMQ